MSGIFKNQQKRRLNRGAFSLMYNDDLEKLLGHAGKTAKSAQ